MHDMTEWTEIAHRAARSVGAVETGKADGPTVTVALRVAGLMQGAVHAYFDRPVGEDQAKEFADALQAQWAAAGHALHIVWCAPTRGPHQGERMGAVCCAFASQELPREIKKLHIKQTIGAAQKLAENSVLAIGDEMRRIYELARSHADGLKTVAGQFSEHADEESGGNVATTIEKLSSQMRSFGQEVLERTTRQARDIEQARAWTNDIVKLGQAIANIASNARILTFNARLESARIGEAGRGFAVIAGSIQELATQVRQTNQAVAQLAENLAAALPRLGADALETSRSAKESVGQLEQQLLAVHNRLANVRSESWEALNDSANVAHELQGKANSVIHHLQFQDRANQLLNEAVGQASAVMEVAGLQETNMDVAVVNQVGIMGRQLGTDTAIREEGSIEMF